VAGDVEMVEDLCVAAVRSAIRTSREAAQKEIESVTGGLGLPGMDKLFGQ
jgi:DNA-binding protein YbaB